MPPPQEEACRSSSHPPSLSQDVPNASEERPSLWLAVNRHEAINLSFSSIALDVRSLRVMICNLKKGVKRVWDLRVDLGWLAPQTKPEVVAPWNHSLVELERVRAVSLQAHRRHAISVSIVEDKSHHLASPQGVEAAFELRPCCLYGRQLERNISAQRRHVFERHPFDLAEYMIRICVARNYLLGLVQEWVALVVTPRLRSCGP